MIERKNYSMADLSRELDVPRTTLNDWLSRYPHYIEFEMQGRRKVFFESSLQVLKEIAMLRDSGNSSSEIENALAKNHPVQAEISEPKHIDESQEQEQVQTEPTGGQLNLPLKEHSESLVPTAKQQAAEVAKVLSAQFSQMSENIADVKRNTRRHRNWLIITLLLLIGLGSLSYVLFSKLKELVKLQGADVSHSQYELQDKLDEHSDKLASLMQASGFKLKEQDKELKRLSLSVRESKATSQEEIQKIQTQLDFQNKILDELLKLNSDAVKKHEQETTEFKEQRAKLLKQIRSLEKGKDVDDISDIEKDAEPEVVKEVKKAEAQADKEAEESVKKLNEENDGETE